MGRTPRDGNGTAGWIVQTELLKMQKNGQFPDESAKIIIVSVVLAYFVNDRLI